MNQYRIPPAHARDFAVNNLKDQLQDKILPQSSNRGQIAAQNMSSATADHTVPQNNPLSSKGLQIKLESLVNFLSRSHLKFQVTIQHGEKIAIDKNGRNCR